MSFGGGESESSSQSKQDLATLGLGSLVGLGAFGGAFEPNRGGLSVSSFPSTLGPAWFTPEMYGSVSTLAQPMALGAAETAGLSGLPSMLALGGLGQSMSDIESLMAGLKGAGAVTDIAPITQAAQHFLSREYQDIGEQMGAQRAWATDIMGAKGRSAADVAAQLGTLEYQAQEAAKDRAIQSVTPGLAGASERVNQIVNAFTSLFGMEDQLREVARSETPGGRAADLLQWLSGLTSPLGSVGTSSSESSGWNWNAAMSCWVAAVYFGWYTPEWWNARNWIVDGWATPTGQRFRQFYFTYGPRLAELLRARPVLRDWIRPVFEWFEQQGSRMER